MLGKPAFLGRRQRVLRAVLPLWSRYHSPPSLKAAAENRHGNRLVQGNVAPRSPLNSSPPHVRPTYQIRTPLRFHHQTSPCSSWEKQQRNNYCSKQLTPLSPDQSSLQYPPPKANPPVDPEPKEASRVETAGHRQSAAEHPLPTVGAGEPGSAGPRGVSSLTSRPSPTAPAPSSLPPPRLCPCAMLVACRGLDRTPGGQASLVPPTSLTCSSVWVGLRAGKF